MRKPKCPTIAIVLYLRRCGLKHSDLDWPTIRKAYDDDMADLAAILDKDDTPDA